MTTSIPVVDIFAGPGGLGEGFSGHEHGKFRIVTSAEMEPSAHRTLTLRAFFRNLDQQQREQYYYPLLDPSGRRFHESHLPAKGLVRKAWERASGEALNLTLGDSASNRDLDEEIRRRVNRKEPWVLIGGPPCQAYSLAGRVRNRGTKGYKPAKDKRHFLYQEYLRLLSEHGPAVFVMENVKGILSSQVSGQGIFEQILSDLEDVCFNRKWDMGYRLFSLNHELQLVEPVAPDFLIRAEQHGIPQARHRVIILGVREDMLPPDITPGHLSRERAPRLDSLLDGLPGLRSHLSRGTDRFELSRWNEALKRQYKRAAEACRQAGHPDVADVLARSSERTQDMSLSWSNCHDEHSGPMSLGKDSSLRQWIEDPNISIPLNHEARGHMEDDLARYGFCAAWQEVHGESPKSRVFPAELAPAHANWASGHFADRFRVQLPHGPATTVTSHISKDGHHFIHWDPDQCRSFTVREAARTQTFPDNYAFLGNRTQQYVQVGNAVPPFLATRIADIVSRILS